MAWEVAVNQPYLRLMAALGISLVLMFLLTMSLIFTIDHFHINLSNFYMALMMVAPMGVVMVLVMWGMFKDRRLNVVLLVAFVAMFAASFALGRASTFIGDEQFLRSMIPHHSRAILLCERASITDPRIVELCDAIVETQREEITQMEQLLRER